MLKKLLSVMCLIPSLVFASDFIAGKDYDVLTIPSKASNPVKVQEFFSYGCPWCFRVEPLITTWRQQQANAIQFSRVPVVFNEDWTFYAKAYYTAEIVGVDNKMTPLLFKAIQTDKKNLASKDAMTAFLIENGMDKATVDSAFNHSTTMDLKINQGNARMASAHINAVPAFVINHHYKTDLKMAQSPERLIEILNFLVEKAKKG